MKENEHFWLGVTLSDDPAPDDVFVVASYEIKEDGGLTLEGFADEPAADVDFAFDTVGYGTVVNVEHADAGEDVHAAIRSACALLAGALELSLDQD